MYHLSWTPVSKYRIDYNGNNKPNDKGQRARGRLAWIGEISWMTIGKLGSGASRTERRPKSLEPGPSPRAAANS